ncbi:MAG TPA: dTDP-glucose 4,6-dehydratase [Nitrospirae bacterium]|nr:dTDP-glucose 4,6-dehydratase [Nitrospirota bacterium]HDO23284.1 dTDP-glucose 4,6-dehydratase [Nitrospirota bacterium]HDZ87387.1 dTDP-glucose 4,6-dehydratase [Nitrospirota bacterium]
MKILVTGGCGFIGSNFIRYILNTHEDYEIFNIDALTYAGNPYNLSDVANNERYTFVEGRIEDRELVSKVVKGVDWIIDFAAESHVDRSILNAYPFLQTNIIGLQSLLEAAKNSDIERFLHISTDEVYGSLHSDSGKFTEESPMAPNSPYSASKASGDLLIRSYNITHELPVIIARPSNNYGPFQYPEKFIPLMITNLIDDKPVPLYGEGLNIRDWLFVGDTCRALDLILDKGKSGQIYNIGGNCEKRNIDLVRIILSIFGKDDNYIHFVEDRPGHDYRYALDNTMISTKLGWEPSVDFMERIRQTIDWYKNNEWWWRPLKTRLASISRGHWEK